MSRIGHVAGHLLDAAYGDERRREQIARPQPVPDLTPPTEIDLIHPTVTLEEIRA